MIPEIKTRVTNQAHITDLIDNGNVGEKLQHAGQNLQNKNTFVYIPA